MIASFYHIYKTSIECYQKTNLLKYLENYPYPAMKQEFIINAREVILLK